MKFPDYQGVYESGMVAIKEFTRRVGRPPIDVSCNKSVAKYLLEAVVDQFGEWSDEYRILVSEFVWRFCKRPYFNVYPALESKLLASPESTDLSLIRLPLPGLEIRTQDMTFLVVDECGLGERFTINSQPVDVGKSHIFFSVKRSGLISDTKAYMESSCDEWVDKTGRPEALRLLHLVAGVCLLASNKSLVTPVLLNQHRKDQMTPAEVADYAERAIKRTGRIGFDVGRDLERMKSTEHYRNGCFAKYFVGPNHEYYPGTPEDRQKEESPLLPVVLWRSGAIVNKGVLPPVPTGFKDVPATVTV